MASQSIRKQGEGITIWPCVFQFLTAEGGSLLLLLPAAENEKDTFDQIVAAVRLTARCVQPPTNRRGSHAEGLGMREVWHSRGLGSGLVQDLGG